MKRLTTQEQLEVNFKQQMWKESQLAKRKKKRVPKDKKTKIPKKYLSGLKGSKRTMRASLIKQVSSLYKSGARIPLSLLKRRTRV